MRFGSGLVFGIRQPTPNIRRRDDRRPGDDVDRIAFDKPLADLFGNLAPRIVARRCVEAGPGEGRRI